MGKTTKRELAQFVDLCTQGVADVRSVPSAGREFATSVKGKLVSMVMRAEEAEEVTDRMWSAARNMCKGIGKWL